MTIRVQLVGCNSYTYGAKGEKFEKGFFYDLEDAKARELLVKQDDWGRRYFARVEEPIEDADEVITEEVVTEELEGVKIKRSRGRPRKHPLVKTAGDTSSLEDDDRAAEKAAEAGIEV